MTSDTTSSRSSTRSRRLLVPLATMVVAAGVVLGSSASFTSTTSSAPNVVTAGSFTQENSATDQAIFTLETAQPGDSATGTATVTNTGDLAGNFSLEEAATTSFPAGTLDLVVTDTTNTEKPVEVYSGDLGGLENQSLGTLAPAEARTYEFVVTLDATAGNEVQGETASAVYTWNAIQTD